MLGRKDTPSHTRVPRNFRHAMSNRAWARGLLFCVLAATLCSASALRREASDHADHDDHADNHAEDDRHDDADHAAKVRKGSKHAVGEGELSMGGGGSSRLDLTERRMHHVQVATMLVKCEVRRKLSHFAWKGRSARGYVTAADNWLHVPPQGPYEWAGLFSVDAPGLHQLTLSKVGGKYAANSMVVGVMKIEMGIALMEVSLAGAGEAMEHAKKHGLENAVECSQKAEMAGSAHCPAGVKQGVATFLVGNIPEILPPPGPKPLLDFTATCHPHPRDFWAPGVVYVDTRGRLGRPGPMNRFGVLVLVEDASNVGLVAGGVMSAKNLIVGGESRFFRLAMDEDAAMTLFKLDIGTTGNYVILSEVRTGVEHRNDTRTPPTAKPLTTTPFVAARHVRVRQPHTLPQGACWGRRRAHL